MTDEQLQGYRDRLALLNDAKMRRLIKGAVKSAGNGGESVTRELASYPELEAEIVRLELLIRVGEGGYGAIHLR